MMMHIINELKSHNSDQCYYIPLPFDAEASPEYIRSLEPFCTMAASLSS